VAILRQLYDDGKLEDNKLFFSNKTTGDIIYKEELKEMLGENAVFITTDETGGPYGHGHIDEAFLKKHVTDFSKHFYVCGPDKMISDINATLLTLNATADNVVFEK